MARTLDPVVTLHDQQNLIEGVAKHFLHKVYGPEGMPWGVKFSGLDELAVPIGQAASRSMIHQALANQTQTVPEPAQACGVCGAATQAGPLPEPRALTTTVGQVDWHEPKRYCPQCRAALFPSVPRLGP